MQGPGSKMGEPAGQVRHHGWRSSAILAQNDMPDRYPALATLRLLPFDRIILHLNFFRLTSGDTVA